MSLLQSLARNSKPKKNEIQKAVLIDTKKEEEKEKLSIAEIVTKARKENYRIIYKKEVDPLSDLAFNKISKDFDQVIRMTKNLQTEDLNKIYDMIDISDDIKKSFAHINYEEYWRRACYEHFNSPNVFLHGDNWKQCYAENFIRDLLMNFSEETSSDMITYLILMKNYIFNLEVPYFAANFDISLIPKYFLNLTTLNLKYSPKLLDKKNEKQNLFTKKITRKNFNYISNKG